MQTSCTIRELATFLDAQILGDENVVITGIATLEDAGEGDLAFFANEKYLSDFVKTQASVVICAPKFSADAPTHCLVMDNPYYGFARVSLLIAAALNPQYLPGIHESAVVADSAVVGKGVFIGPGVVIGAHAVIGDRSIIRERVSIGEHVSVGADALIYPQVSIYHHCLVGERVIIHSGAVIGSDGFGFASDSEKKWQKIYHLGKVTIGDDVEIGANTTIDRGTMGDTQIGHGVKLDNQIQIGHNVEIGDHTIMAGATGVAGSAKIGKHCMIGGRCSILGHISIVDHTVLMGGACIGRSIDKPDAFASFLPAQPAKEWKRNLVRIMSLDKTIKEINKKIKQLTSC